MNSDVFLLIYGWAAYLSAAATILTFVTGILFFVLDNGFGWLNDLFGVIQVLLMIPLIFFFDQLITPPSFSARFISSALGMGGILISGYGQIRLLANRISFAESQKFFPAGAAIGFWLVMVNISLMGARTLPIVLIWIGIAAGIGFLLTAAGFFKGGQQDPVFFTGSLLLGICYPAWGFWLGKIILTSLP